MYSEKFLKNSRKLLRSPFPVNVAVLFTWRALKAYLRVSQRILQHSKGTRRALQEHTKGIPRALGHWRHSRHLDHWALEALGHMGTWLVEHLRYSETQRALEHLGTRARKALGHLDTQAFGDFKGTWVLRHLGTRVLGHTRHFV